MMTPIRFLKELACAGAALAVLGWPAGLLAANRTVDEHRAADAAGEVEIQNVAGRIEVVGWDKPEVAVKGTLGADVERLEFTSVGARTTVQVIVRESHGLHLGWRNESPDEARLVVQIPRRSSLTISLVSADLRVAGVVGNQDLRTVSGDVRLAAERDVRVRSISGDVHVTAGAESHLVDISTVSGDLMVSGGAGELSVTTVSGDGMLTVGTLSRAHLKTVSGDFALTADLAPDGRLEAESVSGDLKIIFAGATPPAVYDLQSFSGKLSTCFGHDAAHEGHGPGSRLSFQEGAGSARVRIDTKSGSVSLCGKK